MAKGCGGFRLREDLIYPGPICVIPSKGVLNAAKLKATMIGAKAKPVDVIVVGRQVVYVQHYVHFYEISDVTGGMTRGSEG